MFKRFTRSRLFQLSSKEVVVAVSVASHGYNNTFLLKTTKYVLLSSIVEECLDRAKEKCRMDTDLRFTSIKLEDGTCKYSFGSEESVGNKHIIISYTSEEEMDERIDRLEMRLSALRTAHGILKARVDESDEYVLCGEIACFVDILAARAAYGRERAETRPVSVSYLLSPWNDLDDSQRANLDSFWDRWSPMFPPHRVEKLTGILRDARFPYAHLTEKAKKADKKTLHDFISNRFKGPDALALHTLLDYVAKEFSSDATPLIER